LFCPGALVTSSFPTSTDGLLAQRTRWEHGYFDAAISFGPRLLWCALRSGRFGMLAMLLDMSLPPLASFAALLMVALALGVVCALLGAAAAWWLAASACALFGLAVALAGRGYGRGIVSLRDLLSVPAYIAAKLPLYLRALTRRQAEWIRTERDKPPK
jgi:cellulose synthase/poly-beta-1,6-N-acetylglucosamine synthase-like glycosyltransferase